MSLSKKQQQYEEHPGSGMDDDVVVAASGDPLDQKRQQQYRRVIYHVHEGHRSSQTAYKYTVNFRRFLDSVGIHDLEVLLDQGKEVLQEMVMKYTRSLRDSAEKKYSRGTVNNRVAPIIYFLANNDIELNRRMIRRYYPSDESTRDDRPYSRTEIQQILSVCDLRGRAIVLLLVSSGVRIGAIHSMRIGDLSPINFGDRNLFKVQVYARTRDKYFTFCTPESFNAIQAYLDVRKRCGEELKDKSPLFRKHFNKQDPFTINVPKFLTQSSIMKTIDEALKESGVKTSEAMRSHAFRKGFMSICEQSGMKSINVKMLLGHNIGVSGYYYRPAESDLLEDYMTHAAGALTIDTTQKLQKQVEKLESEKSEELKQLKAQLIEYKEFVEKTAGEINDLKATRGLERYENSKFFVDPNFSNIVNAVNELRAKNGHDPVAIVTPQEAAEKEERVRFQTRYIRETKECPRLGLTEDYK